ncbi:MAG TPA: hypothetical protein PLG17_03825, partial [Thermodesulfobacteriota bacterium]|nr:hypothetical protein [Thermodesulfobacteriota bacterium]
MKKVLAVLLIAVLMSYACPAFSDEHFLPCTESIARIVSMQGHVLLKREAGVDWIQASPDEELCPGDILWVQEKSRAGVRLNTGSLIRLDEKSTLNIRTDKKGHPCL